MRRRALVFALVFVLLCSGCTGQNPSALFEDICDFYRDAPEVRMTADITADCDGTVFEFTLCYAGDDTGGELTVLAPECVAGLGAHVSFEDGIVLSYDGAELYIGAMMPDGASPMECLPTLLQQWCRGCAVSLGFENAAGTLALCADFLLDGVLVRTWFDRETFLPLAAEWSSNGHVILTCAFRNVAETMKKTVEGIDKADGKW